jgi:hypothetical protein
MGTHESGGVGLESSVDRSLPVGSTVAPPHRTTVSDGLSYGTTHSLHHRPSAPLGLSAGQHRANTTYVPVRIHGGLYGGRTNCPSRRSVRADPPAFRSLSRRRTRPGHSTQHRLLGALAPPRLRTGFLFLIRDGVTVTPLVYLSYNHSRTPDFVCQCVRARRRVPLNYGSINDDPTSAHRCVGEEATTRDAMTCIGATRLPRFGFGGLGITCLMCLDQKHKDKDGSEVTDGRKLLSRYAATRRDATTSSPSPRTTRLPLFV